MLMMLAFLMDQIQEVCCTLYQGCRAALFTYRSLWEHMRVQPINIGKIFEGLSALVEQLFPQELFSGALFIFLNKRKDHIKVLFWDNDGFVIWFKRVEKGTFAWKWGSPPSIDRKTFLMLLEGVTPKKIQTRYSIS